jgi:hypothetical protein
MFNKSRKALVLGISAISLLTPSLGFTAKKAKVTKANRQPKSALTAASSVSSKSVAVKSKKEFNPHEAVAFASYEGASISSPGHDHKPNIITGKDSDPTNIFLQGWVKYKFNDLQSIYLNPRADWKVLQKSTPDSPSFSFLDPRVGFNQKNPYKNGNFSVSKWDAKATIPLTKASKEASQLTVLGFDVDMSYSFPKTKYSVGAEVYNRYQIFYVNKPTQKDFSTAWSAFLSYSASETVNPYLYFDAALYHRKKNSFFAMNREPLQFRGGVFWDVVKGVNIFPYVTLSAENPSLKTSYWGLEIVGTLYK